MGHRVSSRLWRACPGGRGQRNGWAVVAFLSAAALVVGGRVLAVVVGPSVVTVGRVSPALDQLEGRAAGRLLVVEAGLSEAAARRWGPGLDPFVVRADVVLVGR